MKRGILLLAMVSILLLPGCVEWKHETIVFRYDPERDELRMLVVYDGIFGGGDADSDIRQLGTVLARPRAFFFSNWIFEYDRDTWVKMAMREVTGDESVEFGEAQDTLIECVLQGARVMNGAFYLNHDGELAAWQRVTLTYASEVVAAANAYVNAAILSGDINASDLAISRGAQALVIDAATAGHAWVTLDANRFEVRIPASYDDYVAMLDETPEAELVLVRAAGLEISHSGSMMRVALALSPDSATAVSLPVAVGAYKPNLVDFVQREALMSPRPDRDHLVRRYVDLVP